MEDRMDRRTCGNPPTVPDVGPERYSSGRKNCAVLLLAMFLVPAASVVGQPMPRVRVRVSADSVKIGERFTVTLVAEHAGDTEVLFPAPDASSALYGDLRVFRRGPVRKRQLKGGLQVDSVAYEVTTFALDTARVPVLPVRVVEGRDTTITGTPPRLIPVISVVGPNAGGLRTPAALAPFPWPLWMWGALGLAAMALLGGLVYAWRRHKNASGASTDEEPTKSPYEAASARLQHLGRRNPNDRESCKAFYVDLTETLRVYLAKRAGVRALERTTPEVVEALRRHPEIPEAAVRRIRTVLERADLVKFADAQPEPAESRAVLKKAREVLNAMEAAQRRTERQSSADEAPSPA